MVQSLILKPREHRENARRPLICFSKKPWIISSPKLQGNIGWRSKTAMSWRKNIDNRQRDRRSEVFFSCPETSLKDSCTWTDREREDSVQAITCKTKSALFSLLRSHDSPFPSILLVIPFPFSPFRYVIKLTIRCRCDLSFEGIWMKF